MCLGFAGARTMSRGRRDSEGNIYSSRGQEQDLTEHQSIRIPRPVSPMSLVDGRLQELNRLGPTWTFWTIWATRKRGLFRLNDGSRVWRRQLLGKYLQDTLNWAAEQLVSINSSRLFLITITSDIVFNEQCPCHCYAISLADFTCISFGGPDEEWFLELSADLEEFMKPVLRANEVFLVTGGQLDIARRVLNLRVSLDNNYECPTVFHLIVNDTGRPIKYRKPYGNAINPNIFVKYHRARTTVLKAIPDVFSSEGHMERMVMQEFPEIDWDPSEVPLTPMTDDEIAIAESEISRISRAPRIRLTRQRSSSLGLGDGHENNGTSSEALGLGVIAAKSRNLECRAPNPKRLRLRQLTSANPPCLIAAGRTASDDSYKTAETSQAWLDPNTMDDIMLQLTSQLPLPDDDDDFSGPTSPTAGLSTENNSMDVCVSSESEADLSVDADISINSDV